MAQHNRPLAFDVFEAMRARVRAAVVLLVAVLFASACGTRQPSSTPGNSPPGVSPVDPVRGELARADVARATSTDVTTGELADLVTGNTDFAFDLFRAATGDRNALLSPYSLTAALTMTYAGARGTTAQEMRSALQLALSDERIHAARNELDLHITAEPSTPTNGEGEPFAIEVANSLWGQAGYPFRDEFLALLAQNYDAGMHLVDFVAAAEGCATDDQRLGRGADRRTHRRPHPGRDHHPSHPTGAGERHLVQGQLGHPVRPGPHP